MTAMQKDDPALGRATPARWRKDPEWSEAFATPLRLLVGAGAQPSPDEVEALKAGLLRRDELAARLVRAVRVDHAVTMPQFRQALERGIDSVPDAPAALREFFAVVETRPDWVDDDLLEQGARASRRIGPDGQDILAYGSLLGGYRTAAGLEPLVRSGRLAGRDALRRVGETGAWWLGCTSPGGMARDGEGWRLSVHVRAMHGFVNHQLERASDWDWDLRGVPINAVDQAATIGTFSTSYLLHARLLGIRVSRSDARAIMHLWSYAGWLMGVEPQWLPHDEKVGRRVLYQFVSSDPGPDENGRVLATALMEMTDHYAEGGRVARWWRRERGLSMATVLVSPRGMRELGLARRPPWFPAYRFVANVFWSHLVGRLPGGRGVLDLRARRSLERSLRRQHGEHYPPIANLQGRPDQPRTEP
jgi:hypothetical protein